MKKKNIVSLLLVYIFITIVLLFIISNYFYNFGFKALKNRKIKL